MNWDRIEGSWKQWIGKAKVRWGKLTDDDLDVIAGHREQLAGELQQRYGIAKDKSAKQMEVWSVGTRDEWFYKSQGRT